MMAMKPADHRRKEAAAIASVQPIRNSPAVGSDKNSISFTGCGCDACYSVLGPRPLRVIFSRRAPSL
jgi:hypothetical protein